MVENIRVYRYVLIIHIFINTSQTLPIALQQENVEIDVTLEQQE